MATPAKPKIKSKIIDLLTANIENEDDLAAFREYCAVMYLTLDADEKDPLGVRKTPFLFNFVFYNLVLFEFSLQHKMT